MPASQITHFRTYATSFASYSGPPPTCQILAGPPGTTVAGGTAMTVVAISAVDFQAYYTVDLPGKYLIEWSAAGVFSAEKYTVSAPDFLVIPVAPTIAAWQNILDLVGDYRPRASLDPSVNPTTYVRLANRAIDRLNQESGGRDGYFRNDAQSGTQGQMTITGNVVSFPVNLLDIGPSAPQFNGMPLAYRTAEWLDAYNWLWRTQAGGSPFFYTREGGGILLDSAPGGGTLEVWAKYAIPHFGGAVDPTAYLTEPAQMSIAYYLLGFLPPRQADWIAEWEKEVTRAVWREVTLRSEPMRS